MGLQWYCKEQTEYKFSKQNFKGIPEPDALRMESTALFKNIIARRKTHYWPYTCERKSKRRILELPPKNPTAFWKQAVHQTQQKGMRKITSQALAEVYLLLLLLFFEHWNVVVTWVLLKAHSLNPKQLDNVNQLR